MRVHGTSMLIVGNYLPCNIFLTQIGLILQCFSEETNIRILKARNPQTLAAYMMVNAFVSISGLGSTLETSTDCDHALMTLAVAGHHEAIGFCSYKLLQQPGILEISGNGYFLDLIMSTCMTSSLVPCSN